MTVNDIFEKAMSLMDERLESGLVDPDSTLVFSKNAPHLVSILQNELLDNGGEVYNTHNISYKNISPVYGSYDTFEHELDDIAYESELARACYFEVTGPATVYIEDYTDEWNLLETINIDSTETDFYVTKLLIAPTEGATRTRIRFSGDYYYIGRNVALFKQNFDSVDKIPEYNKYVKYQMPSDFKSYHQIVENQSDYRRATDFRWEGFKDLYLPYEFNGNLKIVYKPVLEDLTDLDSELQVDDVTALKVLPYGLAGLLLTSEDKTLANFYLSKYEEEKAKNKMSKPSSVQNIEDVNDASLSY